MRILFCGALWEMLGCSSGPEKTNIDDDDHDEDNCI